MTDPPAVPPRPGEEAASPLPDSGAPFFAEKAPSSSPPDDKQPAPPSPIVSPPASPASPPERPFAGRFFLWLLGFDLPLEFAVGMVSIYVHEFSHGLTALATGGYFLGFQGEPLGMGDPGSAYADAWSDGYDFWVLAAGIAVSLVLGAVLLWTALRTKPLLGRLILLYAAFAFLSDLEYALEGCIFWQSPDFDTAMILQDYGSSTARDAAVAALVVVTLPTYVLLGWGLFRAWEEVFGGLSAGRAFVVLFFLVYPAPAPTTRSVQAGGLLLLSFIFFLLVASWFIRKRRRTLGPPAPLPFSKWGAWVWGSGIIAVLMLIQLQMGIRLGTYPSLEVTDLNVEEKTVTGIRVRYDMIDPFTGEREIVGTEIFIATPESVRMIPSPGREILDALWVPSKEVVVAASTEALFQADPAGGDTTWSFKHDEYRIVRAVHGADGAVLLELVRASDVLSEDTAALYAHDARRGTSALVEANGSAGCPFFTRARTVRAHVTVGDDLWEFTWPREGTEGIRLEKHAGRSADGWLHGISGERIWWGDDEGWSTGDIVVESADADVWDFAPEGLYVVKADATWRVTAPDGRSREGRIPEYGKLVFFDVVGDAPWLIYESGEVRPLETEEGGFRVVMPELD